MRSVISITSFLGITNVGSILKKVNLSWSQWKQNLRIKEALSGLLSSDAAYDCSDQIYKSCD
jgi:hypothetical protein